MNSDSNDQGQAWGHPERYYATAPQAKPREADRRLGDVERRWTIALEAASPGSRGAVERTLKHWNTVLRDLLRSETALRLTVGDESHSVPIRVVDGMPRSFANALGYFEGVEWLILNRPLVEAASHGAGFMELHADKVRSLLGDSSGPATPPDIGRVRQSADAWLIALDMMKAVDQIVGIDEDVLGAYFFRIPEVQLYWSVIGISARALGVSIEALTIVVLAHELAHAYTHLGRDIDNERWDTDRFAACDLDIVEGLAQFYTHVLCSRLGARMPSALPAYQALLSKQSGPYRSHLGWVEDRERGGEIVRVSMIECRSRGILKSAEFLAAVQRHRAGIRGRKETQGPG